jgi:hypothetical protein
VKSYVRKTINLSWDKILLTGVIGEKGGNGNGWLRALCQNVYIYTYIYIYRERERERLQFAEVTL